MFCHKSQISSYAVIICGTVGNGKYIGFKIINLVISKIGKGMNGIKTNFILKVLAQLNCLFIDNP